MIYKILCDGNLIHNPQSMMDELALNNIKLNLEINAAGSLSFDMERSHYYYDSLYLFRSVIDVYRDNECIWRGRIISDSETFTGKKTITCEGALAFLNDIQYPGTSTYTRATISQHLTRLLDAYNTNVDTSKKIYLGNVVTDGTDSILFEPYDYMSCMDRLSMILDKAGGYIRIRIENGICYMDYDYDIPDSQEKTIKFGVNLLDLKKESKIENFANAVLPLGRTTDEDGLIRMDISNVQDGRISNTPYTKSGLYVLDEDSIALFGRIERCMVWKEANSPSILVMAACGELEDITTLPIEIETSFIDMSYIDPTNTPINLLDYAVVISENHQYINDEAIPILAMELDLNDPANNKYTVTTTRDLTLVEYILRM